MNRSILIVICDFLLLSLLTFSTDINHIATENTRPPTKLVASMNISAKPDNDLANVMKAALADEQKNRQQLQQQLEEAQAASNQQQSQLSHARTDIQNLNHQLQNNYDQTQQQLTEATAQLQKQSALTESLRQQLRDVTSEKSQALTNQLLLAEEQENAANEKVALLEQEVQAAHAENMRLAEGFKSLATNSSQLVQEIRQNTPLAPNLIFSDFLSNRVEVTISGWRTGLFLMDTRSAKKAAAVVVSDGKSQFVLCHVQDTPLALGDPGTDWDKLTGTLTWNGQNVPIHTVCFDALDPRVMMIPISNADVKKLGCRVYSLSTDPYRFQDAVLVGANEDYYGQCNFQIQTSTPQYVKLEHNLLKGLFGKFNPSRGDMVFSRTGQLLGIMVNNTYCLTVHDLAVAAMFPLDKDLTAQHTGQTLAKLCDYVFKLPVRLQ